MDLSVIRDGNLLFRKMVLRIGIPVGRTKKPVMRNVLLARVLSAPTNGQAGPYAISVLLKADIATMYGIP